MYNLKGSYRQRLHWISKVSSICSTGLELLPKKYRNFEVQCSAFSSSGLSLTTKSIQEVFSQKDFSENRGWKKSAINTLSRMLWFTFAGLRCFQSSSDSYQLGVLMAWSTITMVDFFIAATYFTNFDPERRFYSGGKTYNSEQSGLSISSNQPIQQQNSFVIDFNYPGYERKYQLGKGEWRPSLFLFSKLISTVATTLAIIPNMYQSNLLKLATFACSGLSLATKGIQELMSQLDPNDDRGWKKSCINLIARSLALTYFGLTLFDPESKLFDFSAYFSILAAWMLATTVDISTAATRLVTKDSAGRFFSAGKTWKDNEYDISHKNIELTNW